MELSGALSNPQAALQGSLTDLCALVRRLRRRPRDLGRVRTLPDRPVHVQALVCEFVRSQADPVRVRDICEALVKQGLPSFDKASVRKTLHDGSRGRNPRFRRVGWGLYESADL